MNIKVNKCNHWNYLDKLDNEEVYTLNIDGTVTKHLGVRFNPEIFEFTGNIEHVANYMQLLRDYHLDLTRATGYSLKFYLGVDMDDWSIIHIYVYWIKIIEDFCGPIMDLKYAMLNYYNLYFTAIKKQHAESFLKVIGEMNDI